MGSSFEYTYTRLASRLRRSARWKCLETGEMTNPLEYVKCLETGETTKALEIMIFQGIWSFLLFLDTLRIQYCLETLFSRDLVVFQFLDTFEFRKCLETGEMTKSLENNDFCSRDFVVFLFLDTFEYGKCLETGITAKYFGHFSLFSSFQDTF